MRKISFNRFYSEQETVPEFNNGDIVTIPDMVPPISEVATRIIAGIPVRQYQGLFESEEFDLEDVWDPVEIEKLDPIERVSLLRNIRADIAKRANELRNRSKRVTEKEPEPEPKPEPKPAPEPAPNPNPVT